MATDATDFRIDLTDQLRFTRRKDPPMTSFSKMTRDELNAYATEHGIEDPESFPNIPSLVEALTQTQDDEPQPGDPDTLTIDATEGESSDQDVEAAIEQAQQDEDKALTPDDPLVTSAREDAAAGLSLEPGLRVSVSGGEHEGKIGEVLGETGDGWRVRLDGTHAIAYVESDDLAAITN